MSLVLTDLDGAESANASGVASSGILCNHKSQYRLHNRPTPVSTLNENTPAHAIPATGWKVWGINPRGARFSALVQTGPEPPPSPPPVRWISGLLPGGQKPGRGVGYPPLLTQVKERVQLYSTSPS